MQEKTKKILLWLLDVVINVVIIIGLVLIIQKWIIAPFDVSGSSMCDNLNFIKDRCVSGFGEKIIINEAIYVFGDPERGEVVVFKAPDEAVDNNQLPKNKKSLKNLFGLYNNDEKYFIKRVIGVPGDKIEIKNGEVFVTPKNSTQKIQIDETYLNESNKGNTNIYLSNFSTFEVPEGKYFLLGDNRKASTDSRSCFRSTLSPECKQHPEQAYINREEIRGKAWLAWWPLQNIRSLKHWEYPELEIIQENAQSLEEK